MIITALGSVALWALGEKTWGLIGFAVSGLAWVAIYALFPKRQ